MHDAHDFIRTVVLDFISDCNVKQKIIPYCIHRQTLTLCVSSFFLGCGWSDGWGTEVDIVFVRWSGCGNLVFGDCMMYIIYSLCRFFDLKSNVGWFPGGGAHSGQPTYTNFHGFFYLMMQPQDTWES